MLIKAGYELIFETPSPVAMLLLLQVHPERLRDLGATDRVLCDPELERDEFLDAFGNRATRVVTRAGQNRLHCDLLIRDSGRPDLVEPDAEQLAVERLPAETLAYLLSSRYCEVDQMSETAWQLFGSTPTGWPRVQAVCDWVHDNVEFGYRHARPTKTAEDVFNERQGVCRDFTHLAITFCRALNIPARYATGYLGDIGVPVAPFPMDFSAWFEVYLGNRWYTFDARHNMPRIGRIVMARGRDAADTALTTSFGSARLDVFRVWTDDVTDSGMLAGDAAAGDTPEHSFSA